MRKYGLYIYFLATLFLFLKETVGAQNETSKWYFGSVAGIDFMTSPPTALTNGNMSTWEGCSSLADASGNLLFYTNGVVVLNRLNQVMANGSGLAGDNSSTQSSLIVKQPGNSNIYYIFTTHAGESNQHSLNYSIVDMSLAAGNGSVTAKNILLFANSSERLTAAKHCNGVDYWIITHDISSDFRSYLLTASGVGSAVTSSTSITDNESGYLKASPSGRKLGVATYADPQSPFSFAILDFDNATGIVSNAIDLGSDIKAYGCEFSPDETKFYACTCDNFLLQWDLCAGAGSAIAASRYVLNVPYNASYFQPSIYDSIMGALQMAPDGKIYLARGGEKKLGVINNPNAAGNACNFADTSFSIFPKMSFIGLPNFMPVFKPALPSFSATVNTSISCNTATFTAATVTDCPYSSYISSILWDFGDPNSGAANASTLTNVTHSFVNPGLYQVKLVLLNHCGVALDTLQQQISVQHFSLSSSSGFTICAGSSLTLSAAPGYSNYSWSNGSTTSSAQVTPSATTNYTVTALDASGCQYNSVETVTVSPSPSLAVSGSSISCGGAPVTQTASGAVTYSWSTGDTNPIITLTPLPNTSYSVTGVDANGCKGTGTLSIQVVDIPSLTVNSATACNGGTATLYATSNNPGVLSYSWSPGETNGASLTVAASTTQEYTVVASVNGCSNSATGMLTVISSDLILSPSATIIPGSSAALQASGGESFTWSPTDYLSCVTCSNPVASPFEDIIYCVTALQGSCSASACLTIAVSCEIGDFSLPNAFTPNGDHNNDEFCLRGWECTTDFNIKVFDRWGENVFESRDPAFCWDGVYKGKPLDAAVFVYVLSAKKKNNEAVKRKGTITLIR